MPETEVAVEAGTFANAENLTDLIYSKNGDVLYFCPKGFTQRKVIVPDTVTKLAPGVFYENEGIKDVYLSENVTDIGFCAFITWNDEFKIKIHAPKNSYVEYYLENENSDNPSFVANGDATTPYEPEDNGGNFDLSSLLDLFGLNG
jgi:hypothetical protein